LGCLDRTTKDGKSMAIGAMNTVVDVLIFGFEKLVASAA